MGKHGKKVTCTACNGEGKVVVSANGSGKQEKRTCTVCNGTGKVG